MASGRSGVWWYVLPRAAAMVLWLPLLLWLPLGVSDPAGALPPPANIADMHVAVGEDGGLYVVTVVAWEQEERIGPLTDAVAASLTRPTEVTSDYPVLVSNQGGVAAEPSGSGEVVPVVALDLEGLQGRLQQLGFERMDLCVSTPNLVSASTRSDVAGLAEGCVELSVTEPASTLEIDLIPDAAQFLKLALPMVVAVGLWLAALVVWVRQTKDEPGQRSVWPMVATIGVSMAAAFFVYARVEYTGFGLAWGLEPWQVSAISLGLYVLVLVPGIVALWPLWARNVRRRLDALPPPRPGPSGGRAESPAPVMAP